MRETWAEIKAVISWRPPMEQAAWGVLLYLGVPMIFCAGGVVGALTCK